MHGYEIYVYGSYTVMLVIFFICLFSAQRQFRKIKQKLIA